MSPLAVAEGFWKGKISGLQAWDLICPERTSKNIGDFCMLMPGQEQVVTTKEVIVIRPGENANFDAFYLMWAMSLNIVRDQWRRVIFMQTNREDVGERYFDIRVPIPKDRVHADEISKPFKDYYEGLAQARDGFRKYLDQSSEHHFFLGTASDTAESEDAIEEDNAFSDSPDNIQNSVSR
ncbi:hypothetical protein AAHB66_02625 [Leclercia sp. S52]|uniref:hypothetical protein n=1 Tax=Leclercia sp. S52 TaxID=3138178 RepID=UPI00321BD624